MKPSLRIVPVLVFCVDPPFKRKKPKKVMGIENIVLFARRSAGERNRIARSFRRKGIRLLVVLEGKEQVCS